MKIRLVVAMAASCLILGSLFTAPAACAFSCGTAPSQPPGEPPHGMNIMGEVAGTKLTGVFEVSFSEPECSTPEICRLSGPDKARAKAILRLRKDNEIHAFYLDLGVVPFDDVAFIQGAAMASFRAPILEAFFGVPQGTSSALEIYLKDMTEFSVGTISDPSATWGTYIVDPADPENRIVEFSSVADLVVAVK